MYLMGYVNSVIEIRKTRIFESWFLALTDSRAQKRILARIDRLQLGNPGDAKPIGEGVSEMRIDYGPGYRVYFVQRGGLMIVLLAGGTKQNQQQDIVLAQKLARQL